jgi:hypothetical protein
MSEEKGMSGSEIAQVFGALGRIEQKIDGHTEWMTKHVAENRLLEEDVRKLQLGAARQRGVLAALTTVGTLLGAGVGYAVDLFTMRGGNH